MYTYRKRFAQLYSLEVLVLVFRGVGRAVLSQTHSPRQTQACHTWRNANLDIRFRLRWSLPLGEKNLVL